MRCDFEQLETGKVRCKVCGRIVTTKHSPDKVSATCRQLGPAESKVKRACKAVKEWKDAGSPLRTTEELAACFATCELCEHYKPGLLPALHKCGKCGCFLSAKARMATEVCPLGKWPTNTGGKTQR